MAIALPRAVPIVNGDDVRRAGRSTIDHFTPFTAADRLPAPA